MVAFLTLVRYFLLSVLFIIFMITIKIIYRKRSLPPASTTMLNDLSTEQLRTFVTIAETGSYTRAAKILYRTQPALSVQIKRLEEKLNTRLFERTGRKTIVTDAGQVLLTYARRILDLNEEAWARLTALETEGSVKVGVLEEVALGPLFDLLTKFGRLCTKIHIELHVDNSWTLAERIKDNTLCLAVANGAFHAANKVPLWEEQYVWAAHEDHAFHDQDPLPLILCPFDAPCPPRDETLDALNQMGRRWEVVFSSASLTAMQAAVRAGLGIGLLAARSIPPAVRVLAPELGLPTPSSATIALYRSTEATSEAADCLAQFLQTNLGPEPATPPAHPFSQTPVFGWPVVEV